MEEDSTAQVNSDPTENTTVDPIDVQPSDASAEKNESDEKQPESGDSDIAFSHAHLEATSAPPLQLLNNESDFTGEIADVPEQILDESAENPGEEANEPSINVNIEDQLKEFDGSDEEDPENKEGKNVPIDNLVDALCDSESPKMGHEVTVTPESAVTHSDVEDDTSRNTNSHKDAFEEVDMSQVEKEKAAASEENDVLSDDRTQATCDEQKDVDHTDDEGTEARSESRMETEQHDDSDHHEDDDQDEADDHSRFEQEEDATTESNQAVETFESGEHLEHEDDSTKQDDDGSEERITPNNDDEDEKDNDERKTNSKRIEDIPENEEKTELERSQTEEGKTSENLSEESTIIRDSSITIESVENTEVADGHAEKMDTSGDTEHNLGEAQQTNETSMEVDQNQSVNTQDETEEGGNGKADEENGGESHVSRGKTKTRTISQTSSENVVDSSKGQKIRKKTRQSDGSAERATPETTPTNPKTTAAAEEAEEVETTEQADNLALKELQIKELLEDFPEEKCSRCRKVRSCQYKYMRDGEIKFLCSLKCVNGFRVTSKEIFHLIARKIPISLVFDMQQVCHVCKLRKNCRYRLKRPENETETIYLCEPKCLDSLVGVNVEKFFKRRKVYLVQEVTNDVAETEEKCTHCNVTKKCLYSLRDEENVIHFICDDSCFNILEKEEENRLKLKRRSVRVRDLGTPSDTSAQLVTQVAQPQLTNPEPRNITRTEEEAEQARFEREASLVRRCGSCLMIISSTRNLLEWETLPFCSDACLEKYQNMIGSNCTNCNSLVSSTSLGKYCVRFGFEVRQFCSSHCLDTYKKKNLKECAHCQKDTSHDKDGFLAPVGDKSQFKDFCSKGCVKKYEDLLNPRKKQNTGNCAVCNLDKLVRVDLNLDERDFEFCSNPCFSAFKFVNNIQPDQCALCLKYFERKSSNAFTLYEENAPRMFCSRICLTVFISVNRKIVSCQWCKVKKYNFDMILRHNAGVTTTLCSTTCLRKYLGPGSINAGNTALVVRLQKICDQCHTNCNPTFSLAMSDSTSRNFCTQQCVIDFQALHKRGVNDVKNLGVKNKQAPYPIGLPKKLQPKVDKAVIRPVQLGQHPPMSQSPQINTVPQIQAAQPSIPTLSPLSISPPPTSVSTLQIDTSSGDLTMPLIKRRGRPPKKHSEISTSLFDDTNISMTTPEVSPLAVRTVKKRNFGINTIETGAPKAQIVTVPPPQPEMVNKQTMCKPSAEALAMQARRPTCTVELQTDDALERKYFVPIPVPIYVPQPMHMYSAPFPVPIPIPLPIPVPIFIPTTRNTAAGIMKEIKKIQDKMPADPFEAELLMMAELVADEKRNESDSEAEEAVEDTSVVEYAPEGDDIFQMDLNISQTGYEEQPNVDIETTMPANAIQQVTTTLENVNDYMSPQQQMMMMDPQRRLMGTVNTPRKRAASPPAARGRLSTTPPQKRHRPQPAPQQQQLVTPVAEVMRTTTEPAERPDANMCLKYTFGVNAWRQWVMNKNADIEKSSIRRKSFKTELLQLTADELNYSLCLFVKEVRKPNGSEYAPDTIYYLVLGIQQYLYENGRIDNIFTDPYYERFTDCLDEVARKFSILYNDSQYIVTRVEEEHLWECKQLGAHSPHVLLSTLMFFNTKHFNLTTVDEHMQLSFSHIMKHWKRNSAGKQNQSTRNVLLRFYPPQTTPDNPRKKKVYEQQENESNPLRCPVKLYEFYLSKCPESVKTRSDVFYLQPERSCVPDSPVWYSTQALSREALNKMLNRVKMVKEINVALLSSQ